MLLAVWMMPSAMALMLDNESSTNKVLLCTQNGYEWVSFDDASDVNNDQTDSSLHCKLCLLSDDRGALVSRVYELNTDLVLEAVMTRTGDADRVSQGIYLHDSPGRAPPFSK